MESSKHYKIIFKKFEDQSGHVEYTINISCENDSSINLEFKDRYSRLKDLHEAFKKEANSLNFPKFPPKKLFGNLDDKFLLERKIKLQHYFNTILGSKDFSKLKTLNKWIEDLVNVQNKSSKDLNKSDDKLTSTSDNNQNSARSAGNNQANTSNKSNTASVPKNQNGINKIISN